MQLSQTSDFCIAARAYISDMIKYDDEIYRELIDFLNSRSLRMDAMKNDRGVSDRGDFKHVLSMPEKLGSLVLQKFPAITANKKNLYKFMREFPQFCAPADINKTKYV